MHFIVLKTIKPLEGVFIYSCVFYSAQKSETIYAFLPLQLLTVLFITKLHRTQQPFVQSISQYTMNERGWFDKHKYSSKSKTACIYAHIVGAYMQCVLQITLVSIFFPLNMYCCAVGRDPLS